MVCDEQVREKFIEDNMGLVGFTIKKYFGGGSSYRDLGISMEDIYQEGCFGLVKAVDKYEESKGKFSTFAVKYIWGYIMRLIRGNSRIVKFPTMVIENAVRVREFQEEGLSIQDIALEIGLTELEVMEVCHYNNFGTISLDKEIDVEGAVTLVEMIEDVRDEFSYKDEMLDIAASSLKMTEMEREVLSLMLEDKNGREIAKVLGRSNPWIYMIMSRVREKLNNDMEIMEKV